MKESRGRQRLLSNGLFVLGVIGKHSNFTEQLDH